MLIYYYNKYLKDFFSEKGSTVIELLVVLIIMISVFSIILISNFPQTKMQLSLSTVAYKFGQDARRAQAMSLSNSEYKNANNVLEPVQGYGIYITASDNKKYIIYADAPPGNGRYDLSDTIVETDDFGATEPGIIIKEIKNVVGDNVSVNFALFNQHTAINPLPINRSIDVVFALGSDATKTKTVSINTAGLIEVK